MSSEDANVEKLGSPAHFWRWLFEQEKLASRMDCQAAATAKDPLGVAYHLSGYGHLRLRVQPPSSLDGFTSDAFVATATLQDRPDAPFTAFIKVVPNNAFRRASALSQRLFDREVGIYQHFHVLLRALRAGAGATNEDIPFNVPRVYYTNLQLSSAVEGLDTVLVMENLKLQGFQITDKLIGSSYEEASTTLDTLANYHALSIVQLRRWKSAEGDVVLPPELRFILDKTMFDQKGPEMLGNSLALYIDAIRRTGQPEAADWLQEQAVDIVDIMAPEDVAHCGALSCVLHADCWSNNMMYRYEEGRVVDMRLVDWQITRLGHPVTDLLHFLFSSTAPETRSEHFQRLMSGYFATLSRALRKLGVDLAAEGYTDHHFRQDVRKRLRWGLFMALMILPIILDQSIIDDIENTPKDEGPQMTVTHENAEKIFAEIQEKWKDHYTVDMIMANTKLCNWMSKLVVEVKDALQ